MSTPNTNKPEELPGHPGLNKTIVAEGKPGLDDKAETKTIWVGKERNIVTEFLFSFKQGETEEENLDEENPEEFIEYKRALNEGQTENGRYYHH